MIFLEPLPTRVIVLLGILGWNSKIYNATTICVAPQDRGAADCERGPERAAGEATRRVLQLVVPLRAGHPGPPALD